MSTNYSQDPTATFLWILDSYNESERSWLFTFPSELRKSYQVVLSFPSNIKLPCTGFIYGELYIISNYVESMFKINNECNLEMLNMAPPFPTDVEKSHECGTDSANNFIWAANYGVIVRFDGNLWTEVSSRGSQLHSTGLEIYQAFPLVIGGASSESVVQSTVEYFVYGDRNKWRPKASLPKGIKSISSINIENSVFTAGGLTYENGVSVRVGEIFSFNGDDWALAGK